MKAALATSLGRDSVRILLVEDDANIRAALTETLETLYYSVCGTATTEMEAVASAVRCMPDLMIVDIELSVGSGVAAIARIGETGHVRHIFMSGVQPLCVAKSCASIKGAVSYSRSCSVDRSRVKAFKAIVRHRS